MATPNQTPAHLLQAIRDEKLAQFKARAARAGDQTKSYAQMSDREKDAYVATVRSVRERLALTLSKLNEQGRIPSTNVRGFSSVGGMLAGGILEDGLIDRALERDLGAVPILPEIPEAAA
jgi:hypothetical protein